MTVQKQGASGRTTTKARGDQAEQWALEHLQHAGLRLVQRNFRTPGRGGGEIDLIMAEPDGTLVFVEVRQRSGRGHGGAGASVSALKQRRIVFAAQHFLLRQRTCPRCRFDVVSIDGAMDSPGTAQLQWLRGAFDASGWV